MHRRHTAWCALPWLVASAACGDAPARLPSVERTGPPGAEAWELAGTVEGGDAVRGREYVQHYGCGFCHVVPGARGADGTVGPPLGDFARRQYVAGVLANEPANLILWLVDPQAVKPGTAMPALGITEARARDIAAYLYAVGGESLVNPAPLVPLEWLLGMKGGEHGAKGR